MSQLETFKNVKECFFPPTHTANISLFSWLAVANETWQKTLRPTESLLARNKKTAFVNLRGSLF